MPPLMQQKEYTHPGTSWGPPGPLTHCMISPVSTLERENPLLSLSLGQFHLVRVYKGCASDSIMTVTPRALFPALSQLAILRNLQALNFLPSSKHFSFDFCKMLNSSRRCEGKCILHIWHGYLYEAYMYLPQIVQGCIVIKYQIHRAKDFVPRPKEERQNALTAARPRSLVNVDFANHRTSSL